MPRVAQAPRANSTRSNSTRSNSRVASGSLSQSPFKNSPVKIPLNDDAQEKAQRLQSRQALHEAQINQLKAAATPTSRKGSTASAIRLDELENASPSSSGSPRTPRGSRGPRHSGVGLKDLSQSRDIVDLGDGDDDDRVVVGGAVVTPMKRVPILANFEEWMKMATDNKINAANSWNFALIDYFHDMSLLKEGDGVNFQKASCTLDGCVKIYTSRVDSVATETGKLLSGLADSRDRKKAGGGDNDDEDGEDDEEEVDEDGNVIKKKPKKKHHRSEATLAPSFASLQLKKLELEFAVDPLFKKASADFDEGGAKGLLLNHLMIDGNGRIVFDSSDDINDIAKSKNGGAKTSGSQEAGVEQEEEQDDDDETPMPSRLGSVEPESNDASSNEDIPIDIAALGQRFFPDLTRLEELDVCSSLKNFDMGDPSGSMDIPFLRAAEDWRQDHKDDDENDDPLGGGVGDKSALFIDEDNPLGFDDTDALGAFGIGGVDDGVDFGEGGEAWAREARLEPQMRVYNAGAGDDDMLLGGDDVGAGGIDDVNADFTIAMGHAGNNQADKMHENILSYFDQALRKNWSSAEHWRIRKIKDGSRLASQEQVGPKRKEKEPFSIDFDAPLEQPLAELLYTEASSNAAITLPKKDWKAKSRNLLPDDKHFHSKQLLSLFLKPKARLSHRRRMRQFAFGSQPQTNFGNDVPEGEMDEAFWANQKGPVPSDLPDDGAALQGDYDANFFADDGLPFAGGADDDDDGDEFADARDHFSPVDGMGGAMGPNGTMVDAGGMTQGFTMNGGFTTQGGFTTGGFGGFGGLTMTNPADLAFGTTLVTSNRRVRPEYVQYARVAKKVDVRRLKEELWKGMAFDALDGGKKALPASAPDAANASRLLTPPPNAEEEDRQQASADAETEAGHPDTQLKFTEVMNGLKTVYPKPVMNDISTSFCFICLLHLANEKGLVIDKTPELTDLDIRKDWTAEIPVGGE